MVIPCRTLPVFAKVMIEMKMCLLFRFRKDFHVDTFYVKPLKSNGIPDTVVLII